MKFFTKVTLISAMAVATNAMALQSMDDDALSSATGQDGITITLNTDANGITIDQLYLHDNDDLSLATNIAGATQTAGAIGISNIQITTVDNNGNDQAGTLATVKIDTDGGNAVNGSNAFLNVGLQLGNIKIALDNITVGASNDKDAMTGATRGTVNDTTILSGYDGNAKKLSVVLGGSNLNIQLGNIENAQGAMIKATGTINGGLKLSNIAIQDASGGGAIGIDNIIVTDSNSSNLTANANISATADGLKITSASSSLKHDVYLDQIRLGALSGMASGATKAIGDVELQGVNANAVSVFITGH